MRCIAIFYLSIINNALGVLKRTAQKVQATTTGRTNINIPQQYCWHKLVDEVYNYLRTINTGLCQKSGKTFSEVMPHFLIGLDEMCLMSNSHGDLRVVDSADKKSRRSSCKTVVVPSQWFAQEQWQVPQGQRISC